MCSVCSNNIVTIAEERQAQIERMLLQSSNAPLPAGAQRLEETYGHDFQEIFAPLLDELKSHQSAGLHRNSFERLVKIGHAFGVALPWKDIDEFDTFMNDDNKDLVL